MASVTEVRDQVLSSLNADAERSRLDFGGVEVSFHCDKFNTRIIKGLEDVLGFEDARKLLVEESEKAHLKFLEATLKNGPASAAFQALSPADKLQAVFEVYKLLAYGAFDGSGLSEKGGTVTSKTSYLAEGWLENLERWNWSLRENPLCHDACGHIAAAAEFAFGKPAGTFKVKETKCRSKGDDICEFVVEV